MGNSQRKQVKDQGKKAREPEETTDPHPHVSELVSVQYLPVKSLEPGRWWVHGIREEIALTTGLRRLDKNGGMCHLPDKPRNEEVSGKALIQDLMKGHRHVNQLPLRDLYAAQDDLENLTLLQLLRIRVVTVDKVSLGTGGSNVQQFMQKLDTLLLQGVGLGVSGKLFGDLNEDALRRLGRDVALVSAAAATLQEPCWWVCFAAHHRIWFNPKLCKVSPLFPQNGGVLEIADYSKADPHSVRQRRLLDWEVCLKVSEHEVSLERLCSENPRVLGMGRQRPVHGRS